MCQSPHVPAGPSCAQIINILPGPFVIIDRDYRIVAANENYLRHYGLDADQVVGNFCHKVSHHSDVPCSQHGEHCPLETVFETGKPTHVMHVHSCGDGHEERVQLQASPIFDEQGRVRYMGECINPINTRDDDRTLVGRSRSVLRLTSMLQRVAGTDTTVLLLGESGSGKERVAEYLHQHSSRSQAPFVVVDCGALGETLIESELFGYEKGAFTGAGRRKQGLIEAAHGGTLFIDEIGELPLSLQTKLLRVLETGSIRRLGGTELIRVNVRVLAATNRDLTRMVETGGFRQDLYYRLSAFPVEVPPLRERLDDVVALAEHFLLHMEDGDRHVPLQPEVIEALLGYDYPGNVRELRNIIERAAILAMDDVIRAEHLVFSGPRRRAAEPAAPETGLFERRRPSREEVESALQWCGGHRGQAARRLGVSERTLYRYIREWRDAAS